MEIIGMSLRISASNMQCLGSSPNSTAIPASCECISLAMMAHMSGFLPLHSNYQTINLPLGTLARSRNRILSATQITPIICNLERYNSELHNSRCWNSERLKSQLLKSWKLKLPKPQFPWRKIGDYRLKLCLWRLGPALINFSASFLQKSHSLTSSSIV